MLGMLSGAAGGGMSQSSSATSGATGGAQDTAMGEFNFKTASGASSTGSGLSLPIAGAVLIVGLAAVWLIARRK